MFDLFYSSKETPDSLKNRGNILLGEGRIQEAEQLYRKAVGLDPGFMPAHYNLGNVLRMQGRLEEAMAEYEMALKLAPSDYEICMNMGATLLDLRREADALQVFSRASKFMPTAAEPLVNMGLALERMEQAGKTPSNLGTAAEHYRKALSIKPDSAEALNNLGFALQSQGNFSGAAEIYRKALSVRPDFAEAYNNLGNALQSQELFEEAIECFQRALSLKPDFVDARYNLGNAHKDVRLLAEAEDDYRKVLALDPEHIRTLNSLGSLLMNDRPDEALACFRRVIDLDPENGTASHLLASVSGIVPERASSQYVTELFEGLAYNYEANLLENMNYDVPEKLVALITDFARPDIPKWDVLDLGCGTGLAGLAIAPYARQLVGVDLSAAMLERAQEKNLYRRLEKSELLAMMKSEMASSYDVIIAADVFAYFGKLDPVMEEIKRLLRPGGMLAFSVESPESPSDEEDIQKGYQLNQTGRYAHSSDYIGKMAIMNGFNRLSLVPGNIRLEKGKPVEGWLALFENIAHEKP